MSEITEKIAQLGITEQQKRFCELYLLHFDLKKAFQEAYPDMKVPNPLGRGRFLFKKQKIQRAIELMRRDVAARIDLQIENVLREQMSIAFASMKDIAEWNADRVTLKNSSEVPDAAAAAIMELRDTKEGVAVRLHPKKDALDALMKFLRAPKLVDEEEEAPADVKKILSDPKYRFLIEEISRKIVALPELPESQRKRIGEIVD